MIQDPVLVNDWHVVARSSDLPAGKVLRARLLGEEIVLWRSGSGSVMAWQDLCIHRGARLSLGWVSGDRLVCPYHGWEYDVNGVCVRIPAHPDQKPPAKARVRTYRAVERYGYIWVSLGDPKTDVPYFAEWYDSSFRKIYCGPYRIRSSGPRAIENFLDVAHFPFVHAGFLGDPSRPEIPDYEVVKTEEGIVAKNIRVWQPNPDGTGVGRWETYTYMVLRPLTTYFTKESNGKVFSIFYTVTPVEQAESIGWMIIAMNYAHEVPEEQIRSFEDKIVSQDVPVVESQRPELLPLDLQAELHLRSDKISIAYRMWLRELGLTFGTA